MAPRQRTDVRQGDEESKLASSSRLSRRRAAQVGGAAMAAALAELDELMQAPDLAQRCRKAAEEVFSLSAGTAAYKLLYRSILASVGAGGIQP